MTSGQETELFLQPRSLHGAPIDYFINLQYSVGYFNLLVYETDTLPINYEFFCFSSVGLL